MSPTLLAERPATRKPPTPTTTTTALDALAADLARLDREEAGARQDLATAQAAAQTAARSHDQDALTAAWHAESAAQARLDALATQRRATEAELADLVAAVARSHARTEAARLSDAADAQRRAVADLQAALAAAVRAFDNLPAVSAEAQPFPPTVTDLARRLNVALPTLPAPSKAPALPELEPALLALLPSSVKGQRGWLEALQPHERRLLAAAGYALYRHAPGVPPGGYGTLDQRRRSYASQPGWQAAVSDAASVTKVGGDAISECAGWLYFAAITPSERQ